MPALLECHHSLRIEPEIAHQVETLAEVARAEEPSALPEQAGEVFVRVLVAVGENELRLKVGDPRERILAT